MVSITASASAPVPPAAMSLVESPTNAASAGDHPADSAGQGVMAEEGTTAGSLLCGHRGTCT